jgi:DNA-directed RNA polymerase specialized sigma subunit
MYIGAAPRGDDRTLIAAFKAGDTRAGDQLFRKYRPSLIRQCENYRKQYPWLAWDDLSSAAELAFIKVSRQFDLSRSNGLNAYAHDLLRSATRH